MNYKEQQRRKQIALLSNPIFENARNMGMYKKVERKFVLDMRDSMKNLYAPIREDVLKYFERYHITWWNQYEDRYFPTGHLLSSQIHCLNHLFHIRKDRDAVLALVNAVAKKAGIRFDDVLPSFIDKYEAYYDNNKKLHHNSNFISFEFVCHNKEMLNETHEYRGEKCTSVDAFVYAKAGGEYWLVPIEWKFTELYDNQDEEFNFSRYAEFIGVQSHLCEWSSLYKTEPFYELGRQSLLMERLIEEHPMVGKPKFLKPLKADKYLHIVVAPDGNDDYHSDAQEFRESLKPEARPLFQIVDPREFLMPIADSPEYRDLIKYLSVRYWDE